MTESSLLATPVSVLQQMLRDRSVSSVELTEAFLGRIAASNEALNAVVTVCEEQALEQAREADAAIGQGELRSLTGIPILHKDILHAGRPHDLWITHAGELYSFIRCHRGHQDEGRGRHHAG